MTLSRITTRVSEPWNSAGTVSDRARQHDIPDQANAFRIVQRLLASLILPEPRHSRTVMGDRDIKPVQRQSRAQTITEQLPKILPRHPPSGAVNSGESRRNLRK